MSGKFVPPSSFQGHKSQKWAMSCNELPQSHLFFPAFSNLFIFSVSKRAAADTIFPHANTTVRKNTCHKTNLSRFEGTLIFASMNFKPVHTDESDRILLEIAFPILEISASVVLWQVFTWQAFPQTVYLLSGRTEHCLLPIVLSEPNIAPRNAKMQEMLVRMKKCSSEPFTKKNCVGGVIVVLAEYDFRRGWYMKRCSRRSASFFWGSFMPTTHTKPPFKKSCVMSGTSFHTAGAAQVALQAELWSYATHPYLQKAHSAS